MYIHIYNSTYDVNVNMIFTKNTLVHMRDRNCKLIFLKFISHSICHIQKKRNDGLRGWKYTPYDLTKNVNLCHIRHKRNGNICGTKHISCEFIWNTGELKSFWCYTTYIITLEWCVIDIWIMNDLRYNVQLNIWYSEKCFPELNPVTYRITYELSSMDDIWTYR